MTTPVADFVTNPNAAFAVFAANEGAWGNNIKVRYDNFDDTDNTFDVLVYETVDGIDVLRERFTVSRQYKKDGFGKQLFIEERINNKSKYIYVINNSAQPDTAMPQHTVTGEALFTGDGTTTQFVGSFAQTPVQRNSVNIGGIIDSGSGQLLGPGVSGTINYETGAYSLTYTTAPANGTAVTADYMYASIVQLSGGVDGDAPTDGQIMQALDLLANPDDIDFRILIQGDWYSEAVQQKMAAICEARQDAFAVLDLPRDKEEVSDAILYRRNSLNLNTSYAGLYGPSLKVYDQYNDMLVQIPGSGLVAAAIASTAPWEAPAGFENGQISVRAVSKKYSKEEYDLLYPNNINLIKFFPQDGIAIWGQRTLATKDSALSRVNVRMLLIVIEKSIASSLRYSQFKINNEFTRLTITQRLTAFLNDLKAKSGSLRFRVVCDETNNTPDVIDREELHVDIYIAPPRAAEFIQLQTVITSSGASFEELIVTGGNF